MTKLLEAEEDAVGGVDKRTGLCRKSQSVRVVFQSSRIKTLSFSLEFENRPMQKSCIEETSSSLDLSMIMLVSLLVCRQILMGNDPQLMTI